MTFRRRVKLAIAKAIGLDPTHSQAHYARFLSDHARDGVRWLELGCGRHILPPHGMPMEEQRKMAARASFLAGIDTDQAIRDHELLAARVYGLGGQLPFREESFDLVTCNMVVEHFPDPERILPDIRRVLKPGGRFLFHTPNFRYYLIYIASLSPEFLKSWLVRLLEQRHEQDRFQTFYRMNTVRDIERLARESGFEVEKMVVCGSNGSFERVWLLGWLECFVLRALDGIRGGAHRPNLIAALRRRD